MWSVLLKITRVDATSHKGATSPGVEAHQLDRRVEVAKAAPILFRKDHRAEILLRPIGAFGQMERSEPCWR
jgi:hypothetical protein